jgi:hypothetical protein
MQSDRVIQWFLIDPDQFNPVDLSHGSLGRLIGSVASVDLPSEGVFDDSFKHPAGAR